MQFEELFREAQRQAASIRAAMLRYERAFGGRVGRCEYVASDVQRDEVRDAFIGRDIPVEWEPTMPAAGAA